MYNLKIQRRLLLGEDVAPRSPQARRGIHDVVEEEILVVLVVHKEELVVVGAKGEKSQ